MRFNLLRDGLEKIANFGNDSHFETGQIDSEHCQCDSRSLSYCSMGRGFNERKVKSMATRKVVNRSAKSGRFVTETYAKKHPATTEREHVYVPAPKTPKGK